jgi:hypothetical protein
MCGIKHGLEVFANILGIIAPSTSFGESHVNGEALA